MPPAQEDTRSRILHVALTLVGRDGMASFTNRRLAKEAGVSLGSLTYHFDSQEALLREALDLFLSEEVTRLSILADQVAGAGLDAAGAARALEAMLQSETERRAAKLELYLQASRDPKLRPAARRCFAAYDDLARTALAALEISDAESLAPVLVAIIDGLQLRRLASGERSLAVAERLETLLRTLRP